MPVPETIISIVAPSRGGGSCLAEAVQAAGICLGDPESWTSPLPGSADKTWENTVVADAHFRVLSELQGTPDGTAPLPAGWEKGTTAQAVRQDLLAYFSWSPFSSSEWGWKHPAGSRLLPLWEELAAASGSRLRLVVAVRHPLEVACSLRRLARLPLEQGLRHWADSMVAILSAAARQPHLFCSYDRFLAEPEREARRLLAFLGREATAEAVAAVTAAARPERRHFADIPDADLSEVGGAWIAELYQHCLRRCEDLPAPPAALDPESWRRLAFLFQFAKMDIEPKPIVCSLQFDTGRGFAEEPDWEAFIPATPEDSFDITVAVPAGTRKVGFVPCRGLAFRSRLESPESAAGPHPVLRSNARFKKDGWEVFPPTEQPLYEIGGPFLENTVLRLHGQIVLQSLSGEPS